MRRTKTKALPSNALPNNWQTLGEFRLPSWKHEQTRTRTWLIMITHALFIQTATRLNCLDTCLKRQRSEENVTFFTNSSPRVYTPGPEPPYPHPPATWDWASKPRKTASFRPNVTENKHLGTKSWSALCACSCVRNVPSRNNKQGHHFQNTYSRTPTLVSVVFPVNVRLCAGLSGHLFKFQTLTRNHFFPAAR